MVLLFGCVGIVVFKFTFSCRFFGYYIKKYKNRCNKFNIYIFFYKNINKKIVFIKYLYIFAFDN